MSIIISTHCDKCGNLRKCVPFTDIRDNKRKRIWLCHKCALDRVLKR